MRTHIHKLNGRHTPTHTHRTYVWIVYKNTTLKPDVDLRRSKRVRVDVRVCTCVCTRTCVYVCVRVCVSDWHTPVCCQSYNKWYWSDWDQWIAQLVVIVIWQTGASNWSIIHIRWASIQLGSSTSLLAPPCHRALTITDSNRQVAWATSQHDVSIIY